MKKNKLDAIGFIDDQLVEKADKYTGSKKKNTWVKWGAMAACLCLVITGSVFFFDNHRGGCSAMPGTIVNGNYYYAHPHGGIWRYSDGNTEKVLNANLITQWSVSDSGLYYAKGKALFRMDLHSSEKKKIYSAVDGTHITFILSDDGNVIVTVYDKKEEYSYQVLIDGKTGEEKEILTEKIPYSSAEKLYTDLNYQVGDRQIVLLPIDGSTTEEKYMPTENGSPLLSEGNWVRDYSYAVQDGARYFGVFHDDKPTKESERLMIFADGTTILDPWDFHYSCAVGHILFYVDSESPENYGSDGSGIWCYDSDTGERWQLKIDSECAFYEFVNDENILYSCVPWSEEQTAWKIVYEGSRPVSLQLMDNNIID